MQGDLLLLAAGAPAVVHRALDRVRQFLARTLGLVDASRHNLLWITGAPEWAPVLTSDSARAGVLYKLCIPFMRLSVD